VFTQTKEQELLESGTARFLEAHYPSARIRELADQDSPFDAALWKLGAGIGWTALLVPESAGGGSVSGNGLADLLPIAFQFGRYAAPGPLIGTNLVAAALARWGSPEQRAGTLAQLLDGGSTAAWAAPGGPGGSGGPPVRAEAAGGGVVLEGRTAYFERGAEDGVLLLPAEQDGARAHYLVPLGAPGVQLAPLEGLDLTRRHQEAVLSQVAVPHSARVGEPGAADAHEAALLDLSAVLQSAEITGAMRHAFDLTLRWTADRYSFGRPLASYQEIKHRMADLRTQLEAAAAITAKAADDPADSALHPALCSAAKAYAGRFGPEVIQDCIQLHGGIGVTYEHDLHLLLRRAVVDAQLFGTPGDFQRRLVDLMEADGGQENPR
jgi:alkylation response protein AidB-like acyl-CoA dehydrogenase